MMNKETYQKAVLVITTFENDRIHTDISASAPTRSGDALSIIRIGSPISSLSDLVGQRDTFNNGI